MTQTFLSFSNFLGEGVSVQTRNGYRQHEVAGLKLRHRGREEQI